MSRVLRLRVPLAAALTVVMAYLSFRFVERPIRQWAARRLDPAVVRPAQEPAREAELAGRT
ncbi:UNVERIFIED_ORG: peptidoglycan/LPS O-acetylase OafA/YrhL [Arthrobacter sp. UYEF2]